MSIISALSRLSLKPVTKIPILTNRIKQQNKLYLHTTPCLLAEPLKKKKKIDPAIIRAREERRRKKLEKQIRRLEKNARQLKPIGEAEIPIVLIDNKKERIRNAPMLSTEVLEHRILLQKKWSQFKHVEHLNDIKMLDRIVYAQQKALDELRKESEELYLEAIQPDFHLIPFESLGPVDTPPIKGFDAADGDYQDVSRKWK